MNRIYLIMAALALCLAQTVEALDGQRQGFFYQVGIGGGSTSADQTWTVLTEDFELDDSAGGVTLDLKVGYGITNMLLLSYTINVGSADLKTIDGRITGFSTSKETASFGAGGVGLTYFLRDSAPSLFVDLAVGVSTWDDGNGNEFSGGGASVGGGYEFKKNWTAEVDYSFGSSSDDKSLFGEKVLEAEVSGSTLGLTINHIWY